jgi:type IV secretory pathway VirB2 component (pilin)
MDMHEVAKAPGRYLLHYVHALVWVGLALIGALFAARAIWAFPLTPLAEIILLAAWLAAAIPLAIRARQREAQTKPDPNAVEHLLGSLAGQVLTMLFDVAIFAVAVAAYFGVVFSLWWALKHIIPLPS